MNSHVSAGQGKEVRRASESQSKSVRQTGYINHWQMQDNVCRKERVEFLTNFTSHQK